MKNFMGLALEQARIAFEHNEVPVGAVLVENGEIVTMAYNQNHTLNDATAHAEILAIRKACEKKAVARLDGCDLYVTLEPCAMCAAAIGLARIRNLYYGCADKKFGAVENGVKFFNSQSCFHKPQIYSGICETESQELLQEFFKHKRFLQKWSDFAKVV
ncbi:MAG TPA: nucleoside deaminase [Rickettsiales bacterium]|nr:nucleoside deaminase [Rickettsiales bacterium]